MSLAPHRFLSSFFLFVIQVHSHGSSCLLSCLFFSLYMQDWSSKCFDIYDSRGCDCSCSYVNLARVTHCYWYHPGNGNILPRNDQRPYISPSDQTIRTWSPCCWSDVIRCYQRVDRGGRWANVPNGSDRNTGLLRLVQPSLCFLCTIFSCAVLHGKTTPLGT